MDDYTGNLLKIARREADGEQGQTPQVAAMELIQIAAQALDTPGRPLPEPIREYLHQALSDILNEEAADMALGIKVPAGRKPLEDSFVTTIIAAYALEIRRGRTPVDAKRAVLTQVETIHDGGRTMDWIDDLLSKHPDKLDAASLMSDEELAAAGDFDTLPQTGIK